MAAINNANIEIKIKADSSDAVKDIDKTQTALSGLSGAAVAGGAGFAALANPVAAAGAAIVSIGAAAVTAAAAMYRLLQSTSEYGSTVYDASIQTGLSAETLSALKLAADTSGSSMESVAASVAKFNVILGQAADGNEKAQTILEKYGVTATDAGEALEQAFDAVANATNKNVAATELFKDKTGKLIPVIDTTNGKLREFTETAKKLGLTLTEEDIKAADDFGDTLDVLGKQAAAVGQQFALELMPNVTHAMKSISGEMENNQGVARSWGRGVGDTVRGVELYFQGLSTGVRSAMDGFNKALGTSIQVTIDWANVVLSNLGVIGIALAGLRKLGQMNPISSAQMGGAFNPSAAMPDMPSPVGGGRAGGGGGASEPQESEYEKAVKNQEILRQAFQDGAKAAMAENDRKLAYLEITEREHVAEIARLKSAEVAYEIELIQQLLNMSRISVKEREESLRKLDSLRTRNFTQETENATDRRRQEDKDLDAAAAALADIDKLREEFHQREMKRIQERFKKGTEADEKQRRNREALDPYNLGKKKKGANGKDVNWEVSGGGEFLTGMGQGLGLAPIAEAVNQLSPLQKIGESMASVFGTVAQAVGSAVRSFVLLGSAGGSFRKFAAEVIASVAQMSVIQAVFEAAQGFARLAMFWFTGDGRMLTAAKNHFISAALFGSIGAVSAGVGRGVAGNAFATATGGGGGSGGGDQDGGNRAPLAFTEPFKGFETAIARLEKKLETVADRTNAVLGHTAQAVSNFADKYNPLPPEAVLMAAAATPGGQSSIFNANLSELESDGGKSTVLKRAMGDY